MTQQDEKLRQIQRAIADLEKAKEQRMAQLSDPKRAKARKLWENLQEAVAALEHAGEDPVDPNGDSLHVNGATFSLSATGELIEH